LNESDDPTHPRASPPRAARWVLAGLAIVLATVWWAYWPGSTGGLVFDDISNIVGNPALHVRTLAWPDWAAAIFSAPSGVLQRPMAMLSFALNHYFTGLDPQPMKLTNVGIHLFNTVLVFGLARTLLRALPSIPGDRAAWAALAVSALWALHPINLMAVLYVVQRMESLAHTFVFAGLWMYVAGRLRQRDGNGAGWWLILPGIVLGTGLGVITKESAAMLPVYALVIEACVLHFRGPAQRTDPRVAGLFVLVLALPAIYGLYRYLPGFFSIGAYQTRDFTMFERLLTESRVLLDYLHWTVLPDLGQLSLFHDDYVVSRGLFDPPMTLVALVALVAMLGTAWALRIRRPLVSLGILWFFAGHAMTATIIPLELVFEHRNYFASLGLCLVLVDLAWIDPPRRLRPVAGVAVLVALLLLFTGVTRLRAVEWSDPLRFAVSEASKHPLSARATYNLARMLVIHTQFRADSPSTKGAWGALEAARRAPRSNLLPVQLSLVFAARTGAPQRPEWWEAMQHGLRTQPLTMENRMALIGLNDCAVEGDCRFPEDQMLATFASALARGPDSGMLSVYGKYALHVMHDAPLALQLWREAAVNGPQNGQFQINLALLATQTGHFDDAQAAIDRLRRIGLEGQWRREADELQRELQRARSARRPPSPATAG
jgi:hypothetical protein